MTRTERYNRIELEPWEESRLPCLGVTWTYFPTLQAAERFAVRAEIATHRHNHPCEAHTIAEDDGNGNGWCVKVRNW